MITFNRWQATSFACMAGMIPVVLAGACGNDITPESSASALTAAAGPSAPVSAPIQSLPAGAQPLISTPNVYPYGGGAIIHPEIVTLYWGSFTSAQRNSMQTYLTNLATFISGSTSPQGQEPAILQYGVRGARVGMTFADTTLPSNNGVAGHTTRSAIAGEIAAVQAGTCGSCGGRSRLPAYNPERIIMVFTNGITFDDDYGGSWCGEHFAAAQGQYYSVNPLPYVTQCGSAGFFGFSMTGIWQTQTSHELFETATDPNACGGTGSPGWANGCDEIGDSCNWGLDQANTVTMSFGAVQTVADNLLGACSIWTTQQLAPIAGVTAGGLRDVFAWANDRSYKHLRWTPTAGWQTTWDNLGGTFTSAPVAVAGAAGANTVDVFGQNSDNQFRHRGFNGTTWGSWTESGTQYNGQPAVISVSGSNIIDVFGLGIDGSYYQQKWTGSAWGAAVLIGGPFNGPPVVASHGTSIIDLVGRGTDGNY